MFQERYNRIVLPFFFIIDLTILMALPVFTAKANTNGLISWTYLFIITFFWVIPSLYFKSYRAPRVHSIRAALRPTFFTWCGFTVFYIIFITFGLFPFFRPVFHGSFLLGLGFTQLIVSLGRFSFFHQYRLKGKNVRNALLIGSILNQKQSEKLRQDGLHCGYHITHTIDDINKVDDELMEILKERKIDIIFLREIGDGISKKVSDWCDQNGVRLKLLLNMDPVTGRKAGLDIMGGFPIMDVRKEPLLYLGNRALKRAVDIIMASLSIALVLTWLPVIVKIAQIVSYPGPLFFIQKRIGRDGKIFNLYKFRTMLHSKEAKLAKMGKAEKTAEQDARVPWFGRLLRKTNLDEYPQFLNVLFGSMSTVGPRPHMVGEDHDLAEKVVNYRVRRFVKPGITGWAAINGFRGGTNDMNLMSKRTKQDIWYLENWSIWLDIKIMAITVWQMLTFRIPKAY